MSLHLICQIAGMGGNLWAPHDPIHFKTILESLNDVSAILTQLLWSLDEVSTAGLSS